MLLTIDDLLPFEIIYYINRLIHNSYQCVINSLIDSRVERIEDAMVMDDSLTFYHLHYIDNIPMAHYPFMCTDSYKKSTYKWVYETYECCIGDDGLGDGCSKRDLNLQDITFYINGERYRSLWFPLENRFKIIKVQ